MAEPARVVLIPNFGERVGGGEESVLTLARALDRARFTPYAIVPSDGTIARALRDLDIATEIVRLPAVRPWTVPAALAACRQLRARLAAWRIDVAHAHGSRGALCGGLAAPSLGIPLVWHVRIVDRDPALDVILLALSARVITISRAVMGRFQGSRWASKARVVYNGIDSDYWTDGASPGRIGAAPSVLVPGRVVPEKGQEIVLRAAPLVRARFPDTRFVLLGGDGGPEHRRLERLAGTLGVANAVEIRPWAADPRPAFREATIVAVPSRCAEGFGRVLLEAGCLEKPVVASRVGGIPEAVLDGETGFLVPPGDVRALADALIRLLGDGDLREHMGQAARGRVLARFTARQHAEDVAAVYAELLGQRAPAASRISAGGRR